MPKRIKVFIKGANGEAEFVRDTNGKVTGVQFSSADDNSFTKKID